MYIIELDEFFSIIEIDGDDVKYILNKIPNKKEENDKKILC